MLPFRPLFLPQLLLVLFFAGPAISAAASEPLVIAESGQPAYALFYIAEAMDYFDAAGVDVRLRRAGSAVAALRATLSGAAHLAALPTPLVTEHIMKGERLGIVSVLQSSGTSMAVLAPEAAGVRGPTDLPGKRVGYHGGVSDEFFLDMFLISVGLSPAAVEYVELENSCQATALEQARVAAVAVSSACAQMLRDRFDGEQANIFFSDVYTDISVLAGPRESISAHAESIPALLQALARAEQFLRQHPDQAVQIVAKALPELSVGALREAWPTLSPRLGLSNVLLEQLQQESEWLAAERLSSEPLPDFRLSLMPRFLRQVDPERVTMN